MAETATELLIKTIEAKRTIGDAFVAFVGNRASGSGEGESADGRSELVRLAARLIIEEALEGEAAGRGWARLIRPRGGPGAGHSNGYRPGRVKSAEGAIDDSAPQIADRAEPFRSWIREIVHGRTEALEAMAIEMCACGLSTRDIGALFANEAGKSLLSRTAVSEITERRWAEYEAFASCERSEFEVVYLFVDGIAERLHLGQPREAVLAAAGIVMDGRKALLHLAPGTKEATSSCRVLLQDLRRRGLPDPLLVANGGAPGLMRAIEASRARLVNAAWRTRCAPCRARCGRTFGRSSMPGRALATRRLRRRWRAFCGMTSQRPTAGICHRRWLASMTTSRRASRTCAFPSAAVVQSARSSDCSARSAGAPRLSSTPSASARS